MGLENGGLHSPHRQVGAGEEAGSVPGLQQVG